MTNTQRSPRAFAACLAALALLTAADLWTKSWAIEKLSEPVSQPAAAACTPNEHGHYYMQRDRGEAVVLIEGFLELRYAENCGAAFGLLDRAPRWLRAAVFMVAGSVADRRTCYGCSCEAAAARCLRGAYRSWSRAPSATWSTDCGSAMSIDFIHFHIHQSFEWPTFNRRRLDHHRRRRVAAARRHAATDARRGPRRAQPTRRRRKRLSSARVQHAAMGAR